MDIIIFAEEYKKLTKGTFLVWSSYAKEASKKHKLTIILNKEHGVMTKCQDILNLIQMY